MKKNTKFLIANLLIIIISFQYIEIINRLSKERIIEYSTMLASKITKYVINSAYEQEDFDMNEEKALDKKVDEQIAIIKADIADVQAKINLINSQTEETDTEETEA